MATIVYLLVRLVMPILTLLRWVANALLFGVRALIPPLRLDPLAAWTNVRANQFAIPSRAIAQPDSLPFLLALVRAELPVDPEAPVRARIRAVGSGHSFSDVAVSDDLIVNMRKLARVLHVDLSRPGEPYVTVEAGITVRELNAALHVYGLALLNMGAFDGQTISGVVSTATHGSGWQLGNIADPVVAMQIVDGRGRFLQLERADSPGFHMRAEVAPHVVKDDRLFTAAVVGLGAMGIAYAYTLRVRESHLLDEKRTVASWDEVRGKLLAGAHTTPDHWEVLVNPYPVRGRRDCLVTERNVVPKDDERTRSRRPSVLARTRNPVAVMVTSFRFFDWFLLHVFLERPSLAPSLIKAMVTGLADAAYIDQSFKVLNLGGANDVAAFSSELALDASDPARLVAEVDHLLDLIDRNAAYGRRVSIPLSLRFVAPSCHLLAPMHQRRTCMVEIGVMDGTPHAWDLLRFIERQMTARGARPHWGQTNYVTAGAARRLYPESFATWQSVFLELNPRGLFDNAFTDRIGLR